MVSDRIPSEVPLKTVTRLIGVYDASGSVRGELAYLIRSRLGGKHCSLCDITHGALRERPEWVECRSALPVPFETVHLNEREAELESLTDGQAPCVVAEVGGALKMLLGPDELEECEGRPEALIASIEAAVVRNGWQVG